MFRRLSLLAILTSSLTLSAVAWQASSKFEPSQIRPFIGTWVIAMSNPAGATETVRIRDENGVISASVQAGRFPPVKVTGMLKDADMLILTLTRFENGKADRAVVSLTVQGDTMHLAQMLEFSETIKRGSGKRQPERGANADEKPRPNAPL